MSTASNTPKEAAEKVKETAAEAAQNVKAEAQRVSQKAADEATQYAQHAKGAAADQVQGVASALRTAAQEMRSGSPQERTMSQIAEGLADVSDSVRDKDLGEMVGSISDFARRNPIAFLGGAALIGFAATRFAKASSDTAPHTPNHTPAYTREAHRPVASAQPVAPGLPTPKGGTS